MQVQTFDQFEFGNWENESFLAVAKEMKGLRGSDLRIKDIITFYETTEKYICFSQWQSHKIDKALRSQLAKESECVIDLARITRELAGLTLHKEQTVYIIHSEWNLLDIVWEDEMGRYRVMWCMTA